MPVGSLAAGAVAGAVLVGSVTALTTPRIDAQASRLSSLERRVTETELDARAFEGRVDDHVLRLESRATDAEHALESLRARAQLIERSPGQDLEHPASGFDIVELGPRHFLLARSVLFPDNQGLIGAARMIPSEQAGIVIGLRIYGIRRTSTIGRLGLQNGDTLLTLNGVGLAGPPDVERLTSIARDSTNVELVVLRRGELVRLHYTVVG